MRHRARHSDVFNITTHEIPKPDITVQLGTLEVTDVLSLVCRGNHAPSITPPWCGFT